MPHKPIVIVSALYTEIAPLLRGRRGKWLDGVELFEVDSAVVGLGGIGKKAARRAAQTLVDYARPELVVAAGSAGAVSPKLKAGAVGWAREVVEAETGNRYPTRCGDWLVVTAQAVSGPAEKQAFLLQYGAEVVDMESSAVAQVAYERGLEFAAVKAISDEADFVMPPLGRFVDEDGRFATGGFVRYIALRPQLWSAVSQLRTNTRVAAANLCWAVEHLIAGYTTSSREQKVPLA